MPHAPYGRPRQGRAAAGIEESHASREHDRERKRLADQYDGFDMRVRRLAVGDLWVAPGGPRHPCFAEQRLDRSDATPRATVHPQLCP